MARGFIIHVRGRNNTYLSAYEISHSQLSKNEDIGSYILTNALKRSLGVTDQWSSR